MRIQCTAFPLLLSFHLIDPFIIYSLFNLRICSLIFLTCTFHSNYKLCRAPPVEPAHTGHYSHLVLAGGPHVAVHLFLLVIYLPIIILFRIISSNIYSKNIIFKPGSRNNRLYLYHQSYLLTLGVSDELPCCLFHISVKLLSLSLINWPLERL